MESFITLGPELWQAALTFILNLKQILNVIYKYLINMIFDRTEQSIISFSDKISCHAQMT